MESKRGKLSTIRAFTAVILVGLLMAFAACGNGNSQAEKAGNESTAGLDAIVRAGKLVVGTSADYPPYEFRLAGDEDGRIVGLDMDIAQDIADALEVNLEIRDLRFSDLFDHLESGEVDMIIAGLTPTEERRKRADFSEIYYQAFQTVLIREADQDGIQTIGDLRGKRVGVQSNSIQQDLAPTMIVGAEFVAGNTVPEMLDMLKNNVVDALVLEKPVAEAFQSRHSDVTSIAAGIDANRLGSAIAVRKGATSLLERVNAIILRLKQQNRIINYVEDAKVLANK